MEIKEVDPYEVNVDEMNERKENLNLRELEKSVEEQGVIQPPIVRTRNGDSEVPYSVVVGQRRTLAAQGAGLEAMPVVVMDWDDAEALEASITENVDEFRERVSNRDRAVAIERLKNLHGWTSHEVGDRLGVSPRVIRNWLEPIREGWEGTFIHPETEGNESESSGQELNVDEVPTEKLAQIRRVTGGGEEGEELLKKVEEHELSKDDVVEVTQQMKTGKSADEAISQLVQQKHSTDGIKVYANVTFSGKHGTAIKQVAESRGMTTNEVVREVISDYLERNDYL